MTTRSISSGQTILLLAAGFYNIAFALWFFIAPQSLFALVGITMPFDEMFVTPLALSIGGASLIYFLTLARPSLAWWLMVLALLSKILPLMLVLVFMVMRDWPPQMLIFIFFNDVIWWRPLWLFFSRLPPVQTE